MSEESSAEDDKSERTLIYDIVGSCCFIAHRFGFDCLKIVQFNRAHVDPQMYPTRCPGVRRREALNLARDWIYEGRLGMPLVTVAISHARPSQMSQRKLKFILRSPRSILPRLLLSNPDFVAKAF